MRKRISALLAVLLLATAPASVLAVERYEVIKIGDRDQYVTMLQDELRAAGYFSGKSTGYFGTVTQSGVIELQRDHKLTVDGKAGPQTRKALLGDKYYDLPANRFSTSNSGTSGSTGTTGNTTNAQSLRKGDRGDAVSALQNRLAELGYYTYGQATGYFGPVTDEAVRAFQRANGLTADGVVGPKTQEKLNSASASTIILRRGQRSDEVKKLQNRLAALGYFDDASTGYFGTVTEAAVKRFQQTNSLTPDGVVDADTYAAIYSTSAKPLNPSTGDVNANGRIEAMISAASSRLGSKYVWSAEGPDTFDCSGLVYYSLIAAGENVPRLSSAGYITYSAWRKISSVSALKRGDLMFFKSDTSSGINHTGIYLGNNQFIHASSGAGKVIISDITGYYLRNFVSGSRVFE